MSNVLRNLPSVNELLDSPPLKSLLRQVNRSVVASRVRSFLDRVRTDVQQTSGIAIPSAAELAERIAQWIAVGDSAVVRPVINATGVLLHPKFGPPPLADEAIHALAATAASRTIGGFSDNGVNSAAEQYLLQLTGAERAQVVNSGASATLAVLNGLAMGREVLVSRGQMIDTGDDYRIADFVPACGATLREVGSTNRTAVDDFANAITERTAAILWVNASSYVAGGAAQQPTINELASLAHRKQLPLLAELGGGALIDFSRYGIVGEPMVADVLSNGADVAWFSGDRLIGGPPCGIIVGRQAAIDRIGARSLMRALRADRATQTALGVTLRLLGDANLAERSIPLLALLSTPLENLKHRCERLAPQIQANPMVAAAIAIESQSHLTAEALPAQRLATWCVAITPASGTAEQLAAKLMQNTPAVATRIDQGRLLIDLRSAPPKHDQDLVMAFEQGAKSNTPTPAS